jgi:hypothetical protein
MVQEDQKFPAENALLARFERVSDNAAIAEELATLLGRAPLFSDFSQEDIRTLAGYMGVYRAQPAETLSAVSPRLTSSGATTRAMLSV